jgi:protein-S-isoprenylcysteine O-methyltransferase Ste14
VNFYSQIILVFWLLWFSYWIASGVRDHRRGENKVVRREGLYSAVLVRLVLTSGYVILFVPLPGILGCPVLPGWSGWGPLGLALCLLGQFFSIWARRVLGTNWSSTVTLKEHHQLLDRGPYALSRHPIYTGILTSSLGASLALGTAGGALGLLLTILGFHYKLRIEERFMQAQFGDAYERYSLKVKKLLPFVY